MMTMDIADAATNLLDSIRADLGAAQNQLIVTINNISITRVNVQSAESQIREVDFAVESAEFSKNSILAQSGSFALAQANQVQKNVLQLLQ
jgi:flagellin